MKFRTVITLKDYRHADLIALLSNVKLSERGACMADLAADAISLKKEMAMLYASGRQNVVQPYPEPPMKNGASEVETMAPVIEVVRPNLPLNKEQAAIAFAMPTRRNQ